MAGWQAENLNKPSFKKEVLFGLRMFFENFFKNEVAYNRIQLTAQLERRAL